MNKELKVLFIWMVFILVLATGWLISRAIGFMDQSIDWWLTRALIYVAFRRAYLNYWKQEAGENE